MVAKAKMPRRAVVGNEKEDSMFVNEGFWRYM